MRVFRRCFVSQGITVRYRAYFMSVFSAETAFILRAVKEQALTDDREKKYHNRKTA